MQRERLMLVHYLVAPNFPPGTIENSAMEYIIVLLGRRTQTMWPGLNERAFGRLGLNPKR